MKYTVLTLFPEIVDAFFSSSIMAKAVQRGIIGYRAVNIRDFALDKHHSCDDSPYGGGAGMLMMAEPLGMALEAQGVVPGRPPSESSRPRVVYLSPSGKPFNQELAREFAAEEELVLICGRYEGIDQRIIDAYVDDEISIGDYVLSSGEVAALVVIDASYRLIDAVITPESLEEESFSDGLLEYPQYTRPEIYGTMRVPDVLLSGHHENIRRWRLRQRVEKTLLVRPDLIRRGLEKDAFDAETRKLIQEMRDAQDCAADPEGET
ncbi:tRNA (guanosine(37)-N1)-methyltransferase TrmD [Breznakiella homolactica]|uniref:tRNA (guanine-N(1)-)-methyltransferase n=1 Tax=Breznakiella homolactica TaxID=2798577 RepID=A0A7T7XNR8_9SPIR|nr:tRNA (guanosine(37)-N1)-methyltransferase TrmD [Breznakiella homolactica]QQO09706.1 tRNA (guanosine(37)-N1)-methyltransferase TrmD [Breznakiella homolactica]